MVIAFGILSTFSGDVGVASFWILLVLAAPVSVLWWFYIHDLALRWIAAPLLDYLGILFVIVGGYLFWFFLVPLAFRVSRQGKKDRADSDG